MAIARVDGSGKLNSSDVTTTADSGVLGWTPVNGDAVSVLVSGWHASGYSAASVTDDEGNTYTPVYDSGAIAGGSRLLLYVCWAWNGSGAPTVTIANTQATANFLTWSVDEWSGLLTAGYDASASAFATGATSGVDAAVTASTANLDANSLVFAAMVYPTGTTITITDPAGYTALYNEGDTGDLASAGAYKIVTASAVQSATWTHDDDTVRWGAAVIVLRGASGVGFTAGSGLELATDEVDSVQHQRQKWTHGADGTATDVSATAPLPVQHIPLTSGGVSTYKLVAATGSNATSVKGSAATVYGIVVGNTNSSPRYLKLYNKASAPTVGNDVPYMTVPVHRTTRITLRQGIAFGTGLALALTTGAADGDTGGVAAEEVTVSVLYK